MKSYGNGSDWTHKRLSKGSARQTAQREIAQALLSEDTTDDDWDEEATAAIYCYYYKEQCDCFD